MRSLPDLTNPVRRVAGKAASLRWLRRLCSALFFAAAGYLIWRQLAGMSVKAFIAALAATSPLAIGGGIALTLASYLCLSGSEWLALQALGHRLGYLQAARVAIPAYALTNSAGFSPATGTAFRVEMYGARGLSALQSAQVAMLAGAAVTLSGFVAMGMTVAIDPSIGRALHGGRLWIFISAVGLCAPGVLWFLAFRPGAPAWLGGGHPSRLSDIDRLLGLGAGLGDWLFSSAALFVLLPHPDPAAFAGYFVAYTVGCILSAATGVPGGIGVFEAIVLAITSIISDVHETAAALLLYRVTYSLGPLTLWAVWSASRWIRANGVQAHRNKPGSTRSSRRS